MSQERTVTINVPEDRSEFLKKLSRLSPGTLKILAGKVDRYAGNLSVLESKVRTYQAMI